MFFYLIFLMVFFRSIKEISRYVKHLLLRKTGVLKTAILSERKYKENQIMLFKTTLNWLWAMI